MSFFDIVFDAFADAAIDTLKVAPFLFLIYFLMELIEHKAGDGANLVIMRSGKIGPVIGGLLGAVPQCGFSAACSGLYSGGLITLGTLFAVFLSTSDEMLPILLTSGAPITKILKIIGTKVLIGIIFGFIIDIVIRKKNHDDSHENHIHEMCEHEGCRCERGVLLSALYHFLKIIGYIFAFSFLLNMVIMGIGEEKLALLFVSIPVVGSLISALVGLIPNCASSIVITNLYLSGIISSGVMMSGLLAGSGIGLAVLFRVNKNIKQNVFVTVALYLAGVLFGVIIDLLGIVF